MDDLIQQAREQRQAREALTAKSVDNRHSDGQTESLMRSVIEANRALVSYLDSHTLDVAVSNHPKFPDSIKTPDAQGVVKAVKSLETTLRDKHDNPKPIIDALHALIPELQAIPGKIEYPQIPQAPDTVAVSNLDSLKDPLESALSAVKTTIESLKLDPQINVEASDVHVDAPDLTPLLAALQRVEGAISAIKFPTIPQTDLAPLVDAQALTTQAVQSIRIPGPSVTPVDPLVTYVPCDIDDASAIQYFGFVGAGGHWYIQKFDTAASPKTLRFTFGTASYDFSAREALTYKIWGQ